MRRYQRWADLKFADWQNLEICGFVGAEWAQEFADLRFANFKKSLHAHLGRYRTNLV